MQPLPLSLIAFGPPSDPRTFSGYATSLARSLRERHLLHQEYSIKDIRPFDVFRGAISVRTGRFGRPRFFVSRRWMWSIRGSSLLARRLEQKIAAKRDHGPFLQIGTLVTIQSHLGPHFVLTDMTIPQAKREGFFEVASLQEKQIAESLAIQRQVFSNSSAIFALSEWTRTSICQDFQVHPARVHVVYAGSNLIIPNEVSTTRSHREILFVGMDWQRKGGPLLLDAFLLLKPKFPDLRLTIVGCQPPISVPDVAIEGFLDKRNPEHRKRLAECYLRASCFCLPSRFDPFPNALIEAASVGLPQVAIDNGSRREVIRDGITGKLAADATPEAIADAVAWLLRDEVRLRTLGEAAKAHAQANFTWPRVVERIQNVITALV